MKIKTNIKAGKKIKQILNEGGQIIKHAGQEAGHAAQDVVHTVSNRKFWTWPW
jgi:hypothetical protein